MKSTINKSLAGPVILLLAATAFGADTNLPAIIPLPHQVEVRAGIFRLTPDTKIIASFASRQTAGQLATQLRTSTGYPLKVVVKWRANRAVPNAIVFTTRNANTNLGAEGYELTVATDSVIVRAPTPAGLFYGAQTLRQLLPPQIFSTNPVANVDWQMPCVHIEDWPRFKWRGLMLDVSRHFFTKPEVEAILDAMALHKLNVFHWHLTDDQGWRIEIKKYPRLTQISAWRAGIGFGLDPKSTTAYGPDGRYGGYYTQADIREVVKYAAARHITIVPEIEMPSHAMAALAAYPQLSSTPGPFTVPLKAGDHHGTYNPADAETFKFLDTVLGEVFQLFPGKYVHIGGDEVPNDAWKNNPACQALMQREGLKNKEELQSWFTKRIERFVNANGKTLVGWTEILQGGLPQNAVLMDWKGGALEAADAGHDVVMSPSAFCYLDFYQSSNLLAEPKAAIWSPPLTLPEVYSFDPIPTNLPPQLQSHILGAQANLWTEWVPNIKHAEYMIFPRECALAEVVWSDQNSRDWNDFQSRLKVDEQRLDYLGVNYRHDPAAQ